MPIEQGTHTLGPSNARLAVHTVAAGTVARVGHDLSIEVGSWSGTLELAEEGASVTLTADGGSLRVLEGHGGMKELDDDDLANIRQTIDDEVLKRTTIEFRSNTVEPRRKGAPRIVGRLGEQRSAQHASDGTGDSHMSSLHPIPSSDRFTIARRCAARAPHARRVCFDWLGMSETMDGNAAPV